VSVWVVCVPGTCVRVVETSGAAPEFALVPLCGVSWASMLFASPVSPRKCGSRVGSSHGGVPSWAGGGACAHPSRLKWVTPGTCVVAGVVWGSNPHLTQ